MAYKSLNERLVSSKNNPGVAASIKASFGKTLQKISIKSSISFLSSGLGDNDAALLVSGLYHTHSGFDQVPETLVSFKKKLKALYWGRNTSDTTRGKIENFLALPFDEEGKFASCFKQLCDQMVAESISLVNVDFNKLYWDLRNWNNDNSVQFNWARTIFSEEKEENQNDDKATEII